MELNIWGSNADLSFDDNEIEKVLCSVETCVCDEDGCQEEPRSTLLGRIAPLFTRRVVATPDYNK